MMIFIKNRSSNLTEMTVFKIKEKEKRLKQNL